MIRLTLVVGMLLLLGISQATAQEKPCPCLEKGKKEPKGIAGKADILRIIPKKFATFVSYSPAQNTITLKLEGEENNTAWRLAPDGEVKLRGWWGRPTQFQKGDRVWVWFALNRKKEKTGILMIADELTEQDIHDLPHTVQKVSDDKQTITLMSPQKKVRTLRLVSPLPETIAYPGAEVYVQSNGDAARLLLTAAEFEKAREEQKDFLRGEWRKHGLAGTVTFLHPLDGEMEVSLDHEAIRWGRYLKLGDKVTLHVNADQRSTAPINGVVKKVQPYRERTRITLVTASGVDQLDLNVGVRIRAMLPEPPATVDLSPLPTDLDRPRKTKEERVEWFLSSVYCVCKIAGDRCTGMFYTLASCNEHGCAMPRITAEAIEKMIDQGLTDRQIMERLLKQRGRSLLKPHLLQ